MGAWLKSRTESHPLYNRQLEGAQTRQRRAQWTPPKTRIFRFWEGRIFFLPFPAVRYSWRTERKLVRFSTLSSYETLSIEKERRAAIQFQISFLIQPKSTTPDGSLLNGSTRIGIETTRFSENGGDQALHFARTLTSLFIARFFTLISVLTKRWLDCQTKVKGVVSQRSKISLASWGLDAFFHVRQRSVRRRCRVD